jgi:integrase
MLARRYALGDAATISALKEWLKGLPDDDWREHALKEMEAGGGVDAILSNFDGMDAEVTDLRTGETTVEEAPKLLKLRRKVAEGIAGVIRRAQPPNISPTSWDNLYIEWARISEAKETRGYAAVIDMLKDFYGERCDLRNLTSADMARFREHLSSKEGLKRDTIRAYLGRIKTMFNTAVGSDPASPFFGMTNPSAGIKILGKDKAPKKTEDRAFSAEQARLILETVERSNFGLSRHADIVWMLKLLTFTGARIREISQLQGGDVREEDGIRFIEIANFDSISNQLHPQKSLKKGTTARIVPIHPKIADFYDHARKVPRGEFIFQTFPWDKNNGRGRWLISHFPRFLREECGIVDSTKRLTLYSLRHRFHDAMDEAGIPDKLQYRLTGHTHHDADDHLRYGGPILKVLAECVARMKPIGSDPVRSLYETRCIAS